MREGRDTTAAAHHNRLLPLHRHCCFSVCVNFFCFTVNLLEEVWFWRLLHGAVPYLSVAVLPRDAEAFDGVFTLLFAPCSQSCVVMAAAVGLCGCVLVARVASSAVAPSLCW
ncbi:hypothetical protein TcCL_ESM03063 [Trypanosoma cruzi]|nr:hypothetical protein TcCL_ESM03063 [Trypanosoma cruzi]